MGTILAKKLQEHKGPPAGLTPNDIRRIRESLSLSQVEAGELLGGGPRAFTKYESGTIKPAASVANLLRLLEANPSALSTLTGRKVTPIVADGTKPFEISGGHIAVLSDRQLIVVMRRLLVAEAETHELPMENVHVSAIPTATDGGEDARIEWKGGPDRTPYLPARLSQFQLKATQIPPAQAGKEILTKDGDVKPMVRSALEDGGTYIVMCAHDYTQKEINRRVDRILETLASKGIATDRNRVQFRDASQIAQWVNAHPPVATWVLEQTQPGLAGPFRAWTHWAGRFEHESSLWVSDPRLDPFRAELRKLVSTPRGVARVVGLAGVGKSRLTLEAFRPTDKEEESALFLSDLVLYGVESEAGSTIIKSTIQALADSSIRAVVVVDQCSTETHRDLAAMVKRSSSRLSLVTIDPERPADPLPPDTLLIDRADSAVVEALLKQVAPDLPSEDHRRLLKFASAYPQMALLLGQAWLRNASIATVSDDQLIDRILFGGSLVSRQALLDAGMLLGAFGLLGTKSSSSDLNDVAPFTLSKSIDDLRAAFEDLSGRGVAQNRGRLLVLQPRPLALHLAERQWRRWGDTRWDEILAGSLPKYLRIRVAKQLALLNDRPIGAEVGKYVCRLNGPFASLDALSRDGNAEILSSLSEIDAEAVVTLLERLLSPLSIEETKQIDGDQRRHLVYALEKIAFIPGTFEQGALLMLKLALAENETWGNNATGEFKAMFPALLGNTAADGDVRLRLLDELLAKNACNEMPLVVDALLEGATTRSYSRSVGAETHGSRPALESWQPETWSDVFGYVIKCLERLAMLAKRGDDIGGLARKGMAREFRSLISRGLIDEVEKWVSEVSAIHAYWPEALDSLADILQFDREGLKPDVVIRVQRLISQLTPDDLSNRAQLLLSDMPWDYLADEKNDFERTQERQIAAVEQLTTDLLKEPQLINQLLPKLSKGQHRMEYVFGRALAVQSAAPLDWLSPLKEAVIAAPDDQKNYGTLVGYLTGLSKRHPDAVERFKQTEIASKEFAPVVVMVTGSIGIKESDVDCVGLRSGVLLPSAVSHWMGGSVMAKLSPEAIAPLFEQLLTMDSDGYSTALGLVGMYVFQSRQKLENLRPQLRLLASNIDRLGSTNSAQRAAHHFKEMMRWLLEKGPEDTDASFAAIALAKHLVTDSDRLNRDLIKPLLPTLLSKFGSIVWPIVGQAIASNDLLKAWQIENLLGDRVSASNEKNPPILSLPEDILFGWCHAHPEVGPALVAATVPIFADAKPDAPAREFHPLIRRLLAEFGDRDVVFQKITQNMYTFSWWGSLATYFALYREPLRSLENHPVGAVRRWAKKELANIEQQIEAERNRDEEREARWDV